MIENHELREDVAKEISPEQIVYTNARVGNLVTSVRDALNYLFASLYPNYIGSYATPGDLPLTADDNSYAFVADDGDGNSAGYVYTTIDGSTGWQKRYDVDWSVDSLLASFLNEVFPHYVRLNGRENGQIVYGGIASGENLELNANSLDDTGKIITHNHLEPKTDNVIDLGEATKRFKDIYLNGALKDATITLSLANLKSAFDHISLTNNPHNTTYDQLGNKLGTVTFGSGVTGTLDLSSSGNKSCNITVEDDSHSHTKLTIPNFDWDVYTKVKAILQNADGISFSFNDGAETITPAQADIDTTEITDIESPIVNQVLASNSTGTQWVNTPLEVELIGDVEGSGTFNSTTGKIEVNTTTQSIDVDKIVGINLEGEQVTIGTHATDTPITLVNHNLSTGAKVVVDSRLFGVVVPELNDTYTVTVVNSNTFTIPQAVTVGGNAHIVVENSQLLFNADNREFELRREYAEITHHEVSDHDMFDDHAQYARVDGRLGGQEIKGGTDDNNDLVLESTSGAVKGKIKFKSSPVPFANASYSGGWSGLDIGTSSANFRHLYMKGELIGARIENATSLPSPSGQNLGRLIYQTVEDKLYYDNGTQFKPLSSTNIPTIIVSMTSETSKLVDLSSTLETDKDTSDYVWMLFHATTSAQYHPTITRTSSSSVTINSELPLTGSFILKGI